MCFSAGASFGAGAILLAVGAASVKKAQGPSQSFFALIPLLFAVQQVAEGFLWLALAGGEYAGMQAGTTFTFLFFAQVLWPVWVPYAVLKLESGRRRRPPLRLFLACGIAVSIYLAWCLVYYPVSAGIVGMHISYEQNYPAFPGRPGGILYMIATVVPSFFSSLRRMWILGTAILVSYIVTAIYYPAYVVSVWCFFASVISITVYAILPGVEKKSDNGTAADVSPT
jgi:hypothetical protein